jgi:hypothetical protein
MVVSSRKKAIPLEMKRTVQMRVTALVMKTKTKSEAAAAAVVEVCGFEV